MTWCTKCRREVSGETCTTTHRIWHKDHDAKLTEDDEEVVLDHIDREADLPWRLALRLMEAMLDARAGEGVAQDDRRMAEVLSMAWTQAAQKALHDDDIGDRHPAEIFELLFERLAAAEDALRIVATSGVKPGSWAAFERWSEMLQHVHAAFPALAVLMK